MNICIRNTTQCIEQILPIDIVAGPLHTVTINKPSSYILTGSPFPIQLGVTDKYNNSIYQSLYPLFVSASGGYINSNEKIQINDFRSSLFVENISNNNTVEVQITNRT